MKIDEPHRLYELAKPKWARARDVIAGQDAVHAAGEVYLPRLKDQTTQEYDAYKGRATFFGATKRTVQALHGMVFRKAPVNDVPENDTSAELLRDVTLGGVPLNMFASNALREVLEVGRCGILVDYPRIESSGVTVAQAQAIGAQPLMSLYKAETIVNWHYAKINNRHALQMVALTESKEIQSDDYHWDMVPIVRVLILRDGIYQQEVWILVEGQYQLFEVMTPLMNGVPMDFIPFQFINAEGLDGDVSDPPLLDLIDVNLSHYKSTADVEHGAHFAGLPTPVVSGYQAGENEKLYIGSATAWVFPDPDAKASYLEFTGQGLEAIEKRISAKENMMAVLGAKMLVGDNRQIEAARAIEIKQTGEVSMLAALANVTSMGLSKALTWFVQWAGIAQEAKITLNTDYMVQGLSSQEVTSLVGAWQAGAISGQTLFYNLKQGEMIEQGVTFEEEQERIGDAVPQ